MNAADKMIEISNSFARSINVDIPEGKVYVGKMAGRALFLDEDTFLYIEGLRASVETDIEHLQKLQSIEENRS